MDFVEPSETYEVMPSTKTLQPESQFTYNVPYVEPGRVEEKLRVEGLLCQRYKDGSP